MDVKGPEFFNPSLKDFKAPPGINGLAFRNLMAAIDRALTENNILPDQPSPDREEYLKISTHGSKDGNSLTVTVLQGILLTRFKMAGESGHPLEVKYFYIGAVPINDLNTFRQGDSYLTDLEPEKNSFYKTFSEPQITTDDIIELTKFISQASSRA